MMNGWDMTGWGWAWMSLVMGSSVLVVVLLALALFRGSGPATRRDRSEEPAEILAERYARGEIDEEEYRRRRGVLQS